MRVCVRRIQIPAFSTLGYGYGVEIETGSEVCFCGDHRPMRELGQMLTLAGESPVAIIESWQVIHRIPADSTKTEAQK